MIDVDQIDLDPPTSSIDMSPDEPGTITFPVTEVKGRTDAVSGPPRPISIATFPGRKPLRHNL